MRTIVCTLCIILGLTSACQTGEALSEVELRGVVAEQGITTYQYGSHVLTTADGVYALTSDIVDLDDYVGEKVTIYGDILEGYPIEGGPVYIAVDRVDD